MRTLGALVKQLPLSEPRKFKIKLAALSNYLSRSFPFERALPILVENYEFLRENFSKTSIEQIFCRGLECWRFDIYSIQFIKTKEYDYEGSFALIFKVGENKIYTLSFSFVKSFIRQDEWVIYIARKQGQPGMLAEFRKTAKTFNDNKIVTMILAATEGLALALGINAIIGVGTKNQLSYRKEEMHEIFSHSYDGYWETQESIRMPNGDYLLPVPMLLKPLEKISAHHKKRTLLKRQRRLEISISVRAFILNFCQIEAININEFLPLEKSVNAETAYSGEELA